MVSVLQNVKTTMGWRKHQLLADISENESPVPDKFKRRVPLSSLNTIRMCLRKRIPLKEVQRNFNETPTWESLEGKDKHQTLQSIRRTAKHTLGTVSQKIQKSCQNPVHPLVVFPNKSIARSSCAATSSKKKGTLPQTPCHNSVTPAAGSKGTPRSSKRALLGPRKVTGWREWRSFSCWLGKDAVPLRRSRRAVALKSPYSSLSANRKTEFDCKLELVSSRICRLKCFSQVFEGAVREESNMKVSLIDNEDAINQATSNTKLQLSSDIKFCSVHQSRKLKLSEGKQRISHQAVCT